MKTFRQIISEAIIEVDVQALQDELLDNRLYLTDEDISLTDRFYKLQSILEPYVDVINEPKAKEQKYGISGYAQLANQDGKVSRNRVIEMDPTKFFRWLDYNFYDTIAKLVSMVAHETVHYDQYGRASKAMAAGKLRSRDMRRVPMEEYYANRFEIMAHARDIVAALSHHAKSKKQIIEILKKAYGGDISGSAYDVLQKYREHMDPKSKAWKRLMKYAFLYAEKA